MRDLGAGRSPGQVEVSRSHSPGQKSRFSGENVEELSWGSVWVGLSVEYQGGDGNPRGRAAQGHAGSMSSLGLECRLAPTYPHPSIPRPVLPPPASLVASMHTLPIPASMPFLLLFLCPEFPSFLCTNPAHPSGSSWSPSPPRCLE